MSESLTREAAVADLLARVRGLPTLPAVALEIGRLAGNPRASVEALKSLIEKDQALATKIIRVSNSAMFGAPGRIGSLDRAIFVLGFQAVRNIAIATSLSTPQRGAAAAPSLSVEMLWRHALATGMAASVVARLIDPAAAGDAFLAGLLHDVGITAEMQYDRVRLLSVIARCALDPTDALRAEEREFGATHQDFGGALLEKWRFPAPLVRVASAHHDPMSLPLEERRLPAIVHVADWMAAQCAMGLTLDVQPGQPLAEPVLDVLGLAQAQVEDLLPELSTSVLDAESMLTAA